MLVGFQLGRAGNSSDEGEGFGSEEDRSVNLIVASEVPPPGPSSGEPSLFPRPGGYPRVCVPFGPTFENIDRFSGSKP